jgi:hypothetical protein
VMERCHRVDPPSFDVDPGRRASCLLLEDGVEADASMGS